MKTSAWSAKDFDARMTEACPHGMQKKAAEKAGVTSASVSQWRSGLNNQRPFVDQLAAIAEALNVSPAWLAYGEGAKNDSEKFVLNLYRAITEPAQQAATLAVLRTFAGGALPVENNGRRGELTLFHRSKKHDVLRRVPVFGAVAAGFGEDLEPVDDSLCVDDLPERGLHGLKVRGDSMEPTLRPGDVLIVRPFNNAQGFTLSALGSDEPKTPVQQVRRFIQDDEIFILVGGRFERPTVKRLRYDIISPTDWHMHIIADNPAASPGSHVLTRKTPLIVYGQVLGIVE